MLSPHLPLILPTAEASGILTMGGEGRHERSGSVGETFRISVIALGCWFRRRGFSESFIEELRKFFVP
jgi:hypothetical protein